MAAKMQFNIKVEGTNMRADVLVTDMPDGGWAATWGGISENIKKTLAECDTKRKSSREIALESLAVLIGKTVEETRQLCEATGKDMPIAMMEIALKFATNKLDK